MAPSAFDDAAPKPKTSSASRRRIEDEAVDLIKQRREHESTFYQRYRIALIVGGWVFLSSLQGLTSPFLPKIKADQLGGDQKAGELQSIIACVGATVGMFTATVFGQLVDSWGRRPFFIIFSVVSVITTAATVFLRDHIIVGMILAAVASLVQQSFINAVVADVYSTRMRMRVLSILMALGSLSSLLVILTTFVAEDIVFYFAFGSSVVTLIYACFIPETLTAALEGRKDVERRLLNDSMFRRAHEDDLDESAPADNRVKCENPFAAMRHLVKSKVMVACVAVYCFYLLAQVGTGDVYMFYLAERVSFNAEDNAYVIMEAGVLVPVVLVFALPFALKFVSPVMIILFSLSMLIAELVVIATVWTLWPIYAMALPLVALTNLLPPVVLGIVQNSGDERDQGRRMAGIQAFSDFADALGPLIFGLMFGNLDSALVFLPFLVSAGLTLVPMGLALRLNKWMKEEAAARAGEVAEEPSQAEAPLLDEREESTVIGQVVVVSAPDEPGEGYGAA